MARRGIVSYLDVNCLPAFFPPTHTHSRTHRKDDTPCTSEMDDNVPQPSALQVRLAHVLCPFFNTLHFLPDFPQSHVTQTLHTRSHTKPRRRPDTTSLRHEWLFLLLHFRRVNLPSPCRRRFSSPRAQTQPFLSPPIVPFLAQALRAYHPPCPQPPPRTGQDPRGS